jgi:signal transduction histidine kinase
MDEPRLRRLLDVGRSLISELEPEAVLQRLLDVARDVTGAQYAAIGVLNENRKELERFLTVGIDAETHGQIGDLPRGRGVLGVLITEPQPLRLADVSAHPRSYGFPLAHPPMTTFLGVPIIIDGEAWGNLYLTDKDSGEFTEDDEEAAIVLAGWAGIAIANARLYRDVRERRDELERSNHGLETMTEVSRALGGVTDLERVLELVVKRSRALLNARAAEIALVDGDEFVIAAVAGESIGSARGARIPITQSLAASAWRTGRSQRFDEIPDETFAAREMGARTAIVTPMLFRNRPVGFLVVMDRIEGTRAFGPDDERLLQAFAASAATAVATAQMASDEALRRSVAASEGERGRWARELHDETLQQFAGLRVLLSGARRSNDLAGIKDALREAVDMVTEGIANLRALITDLRPAALDELGLQAALKTLVERVQEQSALQIDLQIDLAFERGDSPARHVIEVEAAGYRLAQEALTNVIKHADAGHVEVRVTDADDDCLEIVLRDNGNGFDTDQPSAGFGLLGMRERIALVHGTLDIDSAPGAGTTVRARIPSRRREPAQRALAG